MVHISELLKWGSVFQTKESVSCSFISLSKGCSFKLSCAIHALSTGNCDAHFGLAVKMFKESHRDVLINRLVHHANTCSFTKEINFRQLRLLINV